VAFKHVRLVLAKNQIQLRYLVRSWFEAGHTSFEQASNHIA